MKAEWRKAMKKNTVVQVQHSLSDEQAATLRQLIIEHMHAEVANSWAGGGDPADAPVLEAEAQLARVKLEAFIDRLVREGK